MTLVTEAACSAPFLEAACMRFQEGMCRPVLVNPLQRHDSIWPSKSKTDQFIWAFLHVWKVLMILFDHSAIALRF